jgi:hypothetical protein
MHLAGMTLKGDEGRGDGQGESEGTSLVERAREDGREVLGHLGKIGHDCF